MASRRAQSRTQRSNPAAEAGSSKTRVSFLLNHDDSDIPRTNANYSAASNQWRRQSIDIGHAPTTSQYPPTSLPPTSMQTHGQHASTASRHHSSVTSPSIMSSPIASTTGSLERMQLSRPHHQQDSFQSKINSSADAMQGVEGSSPGSNANGDKRGVRKKRQRKFVCDTCHFGFYTNSDLQKHISSVHLLLRPYECTMCDKKFGERSNATKHFKSVHERQKNAECDICHKVFAFRDGLVRHVRLVHENVRNFHCQYPGCGQAFKQSAHLKKHEQVHSKARSSSRRGHNVSSGPPTK